MLKQRRTAVDTVTAAFLSTEQYAEQTAASASRCIAVMIEQRAAANLPIDTGADALQLIAEGAELALKARQRFVAAHKHLSALPASIGIHAYGTGDCPPNEAQLGGNAALRVVVSA